MFWHPNPRVGAGKGLYVSGKYMYTVTRRRNSLCNVARHLEQFHYRMSCDLLVANERLKDYDVLCMLPAG